MKNEETAVENAVGGTPSLRSLQQYDWSGWTEWTNFLDLDLKVVSAQPGAYVLSTSNEINRAIGKDPMGILDIGESGKGNATLRGRLRDMRRCLTRRGDKGHMAGWRFAFFRFERHYPLDNLRIRWVHAGSKKEAQDYEGRVMLTYLLRHSELPPLNYQFNWQPFREIGWTLFDDPACFGACDGA